MKALILIAVMALAGCERYEHMGQSGSLPVIQDKLTGKLYVVGRGDTGWHLEEVNQ